MTLKHFIAGAAIFCFAAESQAAFTGLSSEIYAVGAIPGTITHRIYANFDDPNDQLVAVYGLNTAPLNFSTTGSFYQNGNGGPLSTNINPLFYGFDPALEYDSWFTIGYDDQIANQLLSIGINWAAFNAGGNLVINDPIGGSWFITPGFSPQAFPVGGRVLIAQLTTDGDIDVNINIQWRDPGQNTFQPEGLTLNIPFVIAGCTDPLALNFDPLATVDDGSCQYLAPSFANLTYELVGNNTIPGYDTYRVYANFTNPLDQLVAVFGQDITPIVVTNTGDFYQDAIGGALSSDNPGLYGLFPSLEFDSWFTIGTESAPNQLQTLGLDYSSFEAGGDFIVNDPIGGAWFVLPGTEPSAFPDGLGRVLIAQLTTNGTVDMMVNLQYRAQDGSNPQEIGLYLSFPPLLPGCTYANASNYDPLANSDDGSCIFLGCTDPAAINYDANANSDDGSCEAVVDGCTDCNAINYNPAANTDDGSCIATVFGCTDPAAINYNAGANSDNGSCIAEVLGCTDPTAINFDAAANTDDGSCIATVFGCTDPAAINYNAGANSDNGSCIAEVLGCTDPTAINFNAAANTDDGSCIATVFGCTDSNAFNYDPSANVDNGTCEGIVNGCTDPFANNYNCCANTDDGSCSYNTCLGDLNFDGFVNTGDLLQLLAVFGTVCP